MAFPYSKSLANLVVELTTRHSNWILLYGITLLTQPFCISIGNQCWYQYNALESDQNASHLLTNFMVDHHFFTAFLLGKADFLYSPKGSVVFVLLLQSWQPITSLWLLQILLVSQVLGFLRGRCWITVVCNKVASKKSQRVFMTVSVLSRGYVGIYWRRSHQKQTAFIPVS